MSVGDGRRVYSRVIVQRDNAAQDKYYPKLVGASVNSTFPWTCPTAVIEINTNVAYGPAEYTPPIYEDDIIRLQVDIRYYEGEKSGYIDIFEGRITTIETGFGPDNNTVLNCRGHGEEILYRAITADYSVGSQTTGTILENLRASYLSRLTNLGGNIDTVNSTSITSYNIQQDTKYYVDALHEMESLEAHNYRFSVIVDYDSDGNLDTTQTSWQAVPTTASVYCSAIEGTQRLINAAFTPTIEQLVNDITVYGDDPGTQYVGTATDATSQTEYNTRHHVQTDMTLGSNSICTALATALKNQYKDPLWKGVLTVLGEPNIYVGDLIYCKIPSIEINGSTIDGNYRIKRVSHTLSAGIFETILEVGEIELTVFELLASYHAKTRLQNAQLIS